MASDATPDLTNRIPDIEDMDKVKMCNNLDQFLIGLCEDYKCKVFYTEPPFWWGMEVLHLYSHLDTIRVLGKD